jgi:hypothetical protein
MRQSRAGVPLLARANAPKVTPLIGKHAFMPEHIQPTALSFLSALPLGAEKWSCRAPDSGRECFGRSQMLELMDDDERHRAEISKRLVEYAGEIPSLIERLSEVSELPNLTESQVITIESAIERIGSLNVAIRRALKAEDAPLLYEQLIANTDRLREEIATANMILDRLLMGLRGN